MSKYKASRSRDRSRTGNRRGDRAPFRAWRLCGGDARAQSRALERRWNVKSPTHAPISATLQIEAQLDATIEAIRAELGAPKVLIHNAVGGAFGNFMQIDPEVLNRNFQVNTMALLYLARRLAPAMVAAGEGAIIASGNTSALRGKAGFAGFAPTKAAQRILAESIAREVGPKGVHVAYVLIDAVIDLEWTRKRWPDAPDAFFIKPVAIAEEIWHVAHQDRSAWSFNVEIRPFGETW